MLRAIIIAGVMLALGCGPVWAENALLVESKTVGMGESGTVGVYLSNDEPLRGFCILLVVREVTPGLYPTALSARYTPSARLDGFITGVQRLSIYDQEDGACKNGQPGGFGTVTIVGSGTFEPVVHPSPDNPDGFNFSRIRIVDPALPPGSDGVVPSIALAFTAPMASGMFEIDSTCRDPSCHLLFAQYPTGAILPVFTKGVIKVAECDCSTPGDLDENGFASTMDLGLFLEALFFGGLDPRAPVCPTTRSDLDCDGFLTALDLGIMVDYFWAGGPPPCDPCDAF